MTVGMDLTHFNVQEVLGDRLATGQEWVRIVEDNTEIFSLLCHLP